MNTHILLSILEIKNDIHSISQSYAFSREEEEINNYKIRYLQKLLKDSKEISLDEKDIVVNKDAKDIWINQVNMINDVEPINKRLILLEKSLNNIYDSAYKQALKDLL